MLMFMRFLRMARMVVFMRSVLSAVLMIVPLRGSAVIMLMSVFMGMFVSVTVGMPVRMGYAVVGMLVFMFMGVFMLVQVLVRVFSFHGRSPFHPLISRKSIPENI